MLLSAYTKLIYKYFISLAEKKLGKLVTIIFRYLSRVYHSLITTIFIFLQTNPLKTTILSPIITFQIFYIFKINYYINLTF